VPRFFPSSCAPVGWSALTVGILGVPLAAWGGTFTQPIGLAVGSSYRLVFVTSGIVNQPTPTAYQATATTISTYNGDVAAAAALNSALPATTWAAIASTATTAASANAACAIAGCTSDPLFMPNGAEVAATLADFFAGTTAITVTEAGTTYLGGYVWTGSNADGSAATGNELGTTNPEFGTPYSQAFIGTQNNGLAVAAFSLKTTYYSLYAISAPLVVTATPEPASASLLAVGTALLAALGLRRRSA